MRTKENRTLFTNCCSAVVVVGVVVVVVVAKKNSIPTFNRTKFD
jgi:hypothetical protein